MTTKVKYQAPIWSQFMSCGCWSVMAVVVVIILVVAFASIGGH